MKKLLVSLFLLFTSMVNGQTIIAYDNIETWDWFGAWWTPSATTGYFNNLSVSPTNSAVIYGTGNSTIEQDWYVLPSVSINPTKSHIFKMRLAAQTISGPTSPTAGLDGGDYITVQLSKDGGGYVSELRVRGFSNATWDYSSTAVASKISNGTLDIFTPAGGGNRTNLGDGYSYIEVVIPAGPNSIAIDVYCRVNSGGEDWWMDNFELIELNILPIELIEFTVNKTNEYNVVKWQTSSEYNNSHFILERSTTITFTENDVINMTAGAGNSTELLDYSFVDLSAPAVINYYQLTQVDYDGNFKQYGPIAIDNRPHKFIVTTINLLGQPVTEAYRGIVINIYDDGTSAKTLQSGI
jgi:hypothetical protein